MTTLSTLKNENPKIKPKRRLGRGPGSKKGKTAARGYNGYKSRSGSKKRYGYEGGQMRTFSKLPIKGFSRGRFLKPIIELNLSKINEIYKDGEVVSIATLIEKNQTPRKTKATLKILANGEIDKKVSIEAHSFSKGAIKKLEEKKLTYKKLK
ncbi:MAG: 50S ribosomal protein L15 [Candidatus Anoxychlamydiales bacterium]|uniref:Large ribosomal subunit protein uL15/eL18 domain-containing protein n=1 Tax=marine sediment metagenome TaxID=412755 RepID=A0A0F9LGB5_9ZZZZ|nr:50S ribosomal protein L15 [Candidatus Anoxychlamydiales bacterium]NGX40909.1 50S ribosomal protein L15 [Candidatus Anoxychlamydiales bacterium]HEU64631.1 50S ribosomal protein L15 [Chlamydiota bacterium]